MKAWARVELGMDSAEFHACAPDQLHALYVAWKEREQRLDRRALAAALLTLNPHRAEGVEPITIAEAFPSLVQDEEPVDLERKFEAIERAHNARLRLSVTKG